MPEVDLLVAEKDRNRCTIDTAWNFTSLVTILSMSLDYCVCVIAHADER